MTTICMTYQVLRRHRHCGCFYVRYFHTNRIFSILSQAASHFTHRLLRRTLVLHLINHHLHFLPGIEQSVEVVTQRSSMCVQQLRTKLIPLLPPMVMPEATINT